MSALAITWAISPPIVPAPTTAALKTNMAGAYPGRGGGTMRAACGSSPSSASRTGSQLLLALKGDLDLYTAPRLDDALVEAEGQKWPTLVLDLRELEFLDSMALRLVMRTQARAEQDGRRLLLVRGPAFVERVLNLAGLEPHLQLVDEPPAPAAT